MSSTFAGWRFVLPAEGTVVALPASASFAFQVGDLVCWDSTNKELVPVNESVAGVTDSVANIAASFVGAALQGKLAADTSAGFPIYPSPKQGLTVEMNPIYLATIASTSSADFGDTVGPVVGAQNSVALNATGGQIIGYIVSDYSGQTVTEVRCRLVGKFSPYRYADFN
jgi:hypothetical protein